MTMSLQNKDVFLKDPTQFTIPNHGVTTVTQPSTPEEWATLAWELGTFVCDGEYERGLDRILSTFLANLDQPKQPAVWVSGFYGSGKSHLVRVLEAIWRDIEFPDGERARNKVNLPDPIREHLRELSIRGRQRGGLWSAAGTLSAAAAGGGETTVRLGMLGIIFRGAGLPSQYGRAKFIIWLKQEGIYDEVASRIAAAGRTFAHEISHMHVSPALHAAVHAAMPAFAASAAAVGQSLRAQFPANPADISDDDLVETINDVLLLQAADAGYPGRPPLTLIVFDELQQFIAGDPSRTLQVQQVVEACQARFGSSLLFAATGQAQMRGHPELQKL